MKTHVSRFALVQGFGDSRISSYAIQPDRSVRIIGLHRGSVSFSDQS